ncbi:MAG: mechanosensitive ion channel family protein [Lachnospiraceae bacterium]|nr:mechanosensitive ion channel family protein [Lachnospiraceae bacterium]
MSGILSAKLLEKMSEGIVKDWLSEFLPGIISLIICVILSLVLYWIGSHIIRHFRRVVRKALEYKNAETGVIQFSDAIIKLVGYTVIIFLICRLFGVQSATFAAAIASLGVAVGLALQGSFANFAGGVLILVLKPFVVGDFIHEDTHGNEGTVKEISIFYTKLLTYDGRTVILPNGVLANSSMINVTNAGKRMMDLEFGISYEDDIQKARQIIQNVLDQDENILHEEDSFIFVKDLADSAVVMGVRAWVPSPEYWKTVWRTRELVKIAFDEAGISIPFPQVVVNKKRKH